MKPAFRISLYDLHHFYVPLKALEPAFRISLYDLHHFYVPLKALENSLTFRGDHDA
jgi:hypothetical protein